MTIIFQDQYFSFSVTNASSITIENHSNQSYNLHSTWPKEPLNVNDGEYVSENISMVIHNQRIQSPLVIAPFTTMKFELNTTSGLKKESPSNFTNIYLLMAIQPTFYNFIRFLLCILIQLSVSPLIIYNFIVDEYADITNIKNNITYNIVACLISLNIIFNFQKAIYILTYPSTSLQKLHANGLMLKEINMFYYLTGYYVNLLITIFSFISAVFIVFTADSPIRIILSGFAVTTVNNIDDQIVTPQDYNFVGSVLQKVTQNSVRKIENIYKPISLKIINILSSISIFCMTIIPIYMMFFK